MCDVDPLFHSKHLIKKPVDKLLGAGFMKFKLIGTFNKNCHEAADVCKYKPLSLNCTV